jgi:acylphosphatase
MNEVMVRRYIVKGRVQGVGFRWYVMREASALALRGWVRNTSAGHVEVLAAGTAQEHEALYSVLLRGPLGARVDAIERHDAPEAEAKVLKNFQIEGAW